MRHVYPLAVLRLSIWFCFDGDSYTVRLELTKTAAVRQRTAQHPLFGGRIHAVRVLVIMQHRARPYQEHYAFDEGEQRETVCCFCRSVVGLPHVWSIVSIDSTAFDPIPRTPETPHRHADTHPP